MMFEWDSPDAAKDWDAHRGQHLPTRAEQHEVLLELLAAAGIGDKAVLDLGVGSGLVAEAVLDRLPAAHLVGIDCSAAMLEIGRNRLHRFGSRVDLYQCDLAEVALLDLPRLQYGAIVSVQTMHHLTDEAKAATFAWAASIVEPGGLVVVVDRVRVPEHLFHDWAVLWRLIDPETPETYVEHLAELARAGDQPALLQYQLGWLEAAGLHTTCLHLYGNRAVLVGRKPA